MEGSTLVGAAELRAALDSAAPPVLLDCGFDLGNTEAGERAYEAGHLPGARYAHLDRDLSGAKTGRNGRHPLPERAAFAARVARWGITPHTQVVCYDSQGGPYAARAWWLLRWLGHEQVAVLDGGRQAWLAEGGPLETVVPVAGEAPPYPAGAPAMPVIETEQLLRELGHWTVVDARSPERFRGEVEPLDPVAGRIPGALNRDFRDNLKDGRFRPVEELRRVFASLAPDAARCVHQCGSGVTACHNLLAMAHAGLPGARLYPGSWSEWCADPARPIERG